MTRISSNNIQTAISLAAKAAKLNEVPIGAVLVDAQGMIIGRGYNQTHKKKDGLAHAELIAIKQAQNKLSDWRLEGAAMYITLEPCLMCLGAMANARVAKVCYILADPLFGSVESRFTKKQFAKLFPKLIVEKLPDDGSVRAMMKEFFVTLRSRQK